MKSYERKKPVTVTMVTMCADERGGVKDRRETPYLWGTYRGPFRRARAGRREGDTFPPDRRGGVKDRRKSVRRMDLGTSYVMQRRGLTGRKRHRRITSHRRAEA